LVQKFSGKSARYCVKYEFRHGDTRHMRCNYEEFITLIFAKIILNS